MRGGKVLRECVCEYVRVNEWTEQVPEVGFQAMPSRIPMEWQAHDVVEFLRANRVPIDPAAQHISNHEGLPVDGRSMPSFVLGNN